MVFYPWRSSANPSLNQNSQQQTSVSRFAWCSADVLPQEGPELGWGRRQPGTLSGVTWCGRVLLDAVCQGKGTAQGSRRRTNVRLEE